MGKGRLEAFSDGVIAIIITIMVLELTVPAWTDARGAAPAAAGLPQLHLQLRLSRDLLEQPSPHAARDRIGSGDVLWANLHLLFWLSLVPFVTALDGREPFRLDPDGAVRRGAADGGDRLLDPAAARSCARKGRGSVLRRAVGHD